MIRAVNLWRTIFSNWKFCRNRLSTGGNHQSLFGEDYFQHCVHRVATNRKLLKIAFDEACRLSLSAIDAIHVASAHLAHAAELITLEKKTKPIYRTSLVSVVYLHDVK